MHIHCIAPPAHFIAPLSSNNNIVQVARLSCARAFSHCPCFRAPVCTVSVSCKEERSRDRSSHQPVREQSNVGNGDFRIFHHGCGGADIPTSGYADMLFAVQPSQGYSIRENFRNELRCLPYCRITSKRDFKSSWNMVASILRQLLSSKFLLHRDAAGPPRLVTACINSSKASKTGKKQDDSSRSKRQRVPFLSSTASRLDSRDHYDLRTEVHSLALPLVAP